MMPREASHVEAAKTVPPPAPMQAKGRQGQAEAMPLRKTESRWLGEATLEELLSEPIVLAVMHADGVDRNELEAMLRRLARWRRASIIGSASYRSSAIVDQRCFPNQP